jgi:hypothetical protein
MGRVHIEITFEIFERVQDDTLKREGLLAL